MLPGNLLIPYNKGGLIALRDQEGVLVATLEVEEIWEPDKIAEAEQVYGTSLEAHPAVHHPSASNK